MELGFGKGDTAKAAAYSPALCAAYAAGLAKHVLDSTVEADSSRKRLRVTSSGRVRRHVDRGEVEQSVKEARAAEDAVCRAGVQTDCWGFTHCCFAFALSASFAFALGGLGTGGFFPQVPGIASTSCAAGPNCWWRWSQPDGFCRMLDGDASNFRSWLGHVVMLQFENPIGKGHRVTATLRGWLLGG